MTAQGKGVLGGGVGSLPGSEDWAAEFLILGQHSQGWLWEAMFSFSFRHRLTVFEKGPVQIDDFFFSLDLLLKII